MPALRLVEQAHYADVELAQPAPAGPSITFKPNRAQMVLASLANGILKTAADAPETTKINTRMDGIALQARGMRMSL